MQLDRRVNTAWLNWYFRQRNSQVDGIVLAPSLVTRRVRRQESPSHPRVTVSARERWRLRLADLWAQAGGSVRCSDAALPRNDRTRAE
jgi:hypothetical protein